MLLVLHAVRYIANSFLRQCTLCIKKTVKHAEVLPTHETETIRRSSDEQSNLLPNEIFLCMKTLKLTASRTPLLRAI